MKKYGDFIVEKLNAELFDNNFNVVAEELDSFWNNLKKKVNENVNTVDPKDVSIHNQKILDYRKRADDKPLEDVKPLSGTKPEVKPEVKPLSNRQLNFGKDSTKDLGYKVKLDNYKDHQKKIQDKLKQRDINKKLRAEKRRKQEEENKILFNQKQEKERQKNNQYK